MAISPQTNIKILKVPLEISNKNQLTFASKEEQFEYFDSLEKIEIDKANYMRKDNILYFPAHIDSIMEYNYCIYQNENYSDKWFYAFITKMEYENNGTTKIFLSTDVWQTWQFDLTYKESFIEREMINVSEDIPGANLIPENLEMGEMIINNVTSFSDFSPRYIIAFSGDKFGQTDISQDGFEYNGIFSSITFIVTNSLNTALLIINNAGQGDKIITVFSVPYFAVKDFVNESQDPSVHEYYALPITRDFMQSAIVKTLNSLPQNLNGYTPKNQKLRTYPFLYLGFNPQNGSQKIYRYEDFENGLPSFKIISEINPNPSVYFIPQNYRGKSGDNINDSGSLNGYPTISYKNDVFNSWLAQNSEIINLQMSQEQFNYETEAVRMGANFAGSLLNTFNNQNPSILSEAVNVGLNANALDVNHDYYIKNQMAQIEKQKLLPDTASLSGSNATLLGYNLLNQAIFTCYSIKRQFAERIDKFFDMFGYITNTVKLPNLNNRPNWNYIKTLGLNVIANIPQEDLAQIKLLFNNGLTLWHNPETFLDYSQNNR